MKFSCNFSKGEGDADPFILAPNNMATLAHLPGEDVQRNLMWDAYRARNVESSSRPGHVANSAVDPGAVELDRSGLEDSLSSCCTSFSHFASLG
jgi:hypothetical protein